MCVSWFGQCDSSAWMPFARTEHRALEKELRRIETSWFVWVWNLNMNSKLYQFAKCNLQVVWRAKLCVRLLDRQSSNNVASSGGECDLWRVALTVLPQESYSRSCHMGLIVRVLWYVRAPLRYLRVQIEVWTVETSSLRSGTAMRWHKLANL